MSSTPIAVAAPAPRICTPLLLPQDRIPRAPLGPWTALLRERTAQARRGCRGVTDLSEEAGSIGNNAALIAAQRGDREAAAALCERQLWWQHRLSRRSRRPEIAARCVPAWANLARLESLSGEWQAAVSRLERLAPRGRTGAISLGPIALGPFRRDGMGCQHVPRVGGSLAEMWEALYVIDTLRALLQNRRFDEVFAFSERVRRDFPPALVLWALEASVVAACVTGDPALARRLGREALRRDDVRGLPAVLFRLRLAEVAACAGDTDHARAVLAPLARAARQSSPETRARLQSLYVLTRLASACLEAGLPDDARDVALGVYEGARTADDEVFQLEALRTLAAAAPAEGWDEALRALERATEYRQYRSPDAPAPDRAPLDALLAELSELYAS